MVIEGLECPDCGDVVLDNGEKCHYCGMPYDEEIISVQHLHHSQKKANVEAMNGGRMTWKEATRALPKVVGRGDDGQLILDVPYKQPRVEPQIAPLEGLVGRVRKFFGSLRV